MASSDPKGEVSASTRNSPGAPAEVPVEGRTVRDTGRVSEGVHTRQTNAAHVAQDQSRRDPPGTTPSRDPERVRRGGSAARLLGQGPAAGTMSPVLGRPPCAPRSCPANPGLRAPGVGEGTLATGKPTGAPRATGPDEERRTNRGREARQRGMQPATTTAQDQVPTNNGRPVPQSRTARTMRTQRRDRKRCQATANQGRDAHEDACPPPVEPPERVKKQRGGDPDEAKEKQRSGDEAKEHQ